MESLWLGIRLQGWPSAGLRASPGYKCFRLHCVLSLVKSELADCAEGFRGPWCEQVCGSDMSLCRWDQPIEQGKLQTVCRCSVSEA